MVETRCYLGIQLAGSRALNQLPFYMHKKRTFPKTVEFLSQIFLKKACTQSTINLTIWIGLINSCHSVREKQGSLDDFKEKSGKNIFITNTILLF